MNHRNQLLILVLIPIVFIVIYFACFHNSSHIVKAYLIEKQGNKWFPVQSEIYHISENKVFSIESNHINYYPDCQVVSPEDWDCHCFSDTNCSFGLENGRFWRSPIPPKTKFVSAWKYHRTRCKRILTDPNIGVLWGFYWCIAEWEI